MQLRFAWLLAGVIVLFLAGLAFSVVTSLRTNDAAAERLLDIEIEQARASLMRRWNFYRQVTANLARDPQLIDLMLVGSDDEMQQWATARRRLLPDVLGIALTDPAGELHGDAESLRVGPSCQRDLRELPAGAMAKRVLVHRDRPELAHFDMVAPVRGAGDETLGRVFVSVRLIQLQRILEDTAQPGHALILLDAAGTAMVDGGTTRGTTREHRLPLPEMGWTLVVRSPVDRFNVGDSWHILAGALTLAGVLVLLLVAGALMRRAAMRELRAAHTALSELAQGNAPPAIATRFREFVPITQDIDRIAQQLHEQRAQLARLSLTDTLTGLPNRRAFEWDFTAKLGLAGRGQAIALVLLDLDHFKSINDRLGHAAGDQALLALARALKAHTRTTDMAARLAGDEFAVLLSTLDDAGVDIWFLRLLDRYRSELRAVGLAIEGVLSAGQTWLGQPDTDTLSAALARADRALYRAKAAGRGRLAHDDDREGRPE